MTLSYLMTHHQMETFSALLALFAGNSPITGDVPPQRPVTRGFDVFLDLRMKKRLVKHSRRRWFETSSHSLWCHCNIIWPCHANDVLYNTTYIWLVSLFMHFMLIMMLTHWGRDKMDAISQTTLSNAFLWMKMLEFWLKFHRSLFLRVQLTIFQHWFR